MKITHLFSFFMEVVLTQCIGRLNLGDASNLDEPSFLSLFGSTCRPLYLLCKGTWDGEVAMGETGLLCRAGTCCHCPLSLKSPHEYIRSMYFSLLRSKSKEWKDHAKKVFPPVGVSYSTKRAKQHTSLRNKEEIV